MYVKLPKAVQDTAIFALRLLEQGNRGMTQIGKLRAKQLATKNEIRLSEIRDIRNWFARHIYTSYPSYKEWVESDFDPTKITAGVIAILGWGGDAMLDYVNSREILNLLNNTYNVNYKPIKL